METFGLLFSLLIFIISIFIIHKIFLKNPSTATIKSSQLPPGPTKLPMIGNLHQLVSKHTPPHKRLLELARVYGPIMHLHLGEIPTVVVSSADVAREVMMGHDTNFAGRPKLVFAKELYYDSSDIGLAPYGEYWRRIRKIAVLEMFTAKRVKNFRPIMEEEAAQIVKCIAAKMVDGSHSLINLSEKIFGYAFDFTSRAAFNKKGKDQEAFRELVTSMSKAFSGFAIADLFPSLKLLHSIDGMSKKIKKMVEESNRLLDPIILEHMSNKSQGKPEEDLIDVLLKFHNNYIEDDPSDHFSLTTNNIKGIILEIFSAGSETSSTTVEWAMAELLKHPKAMKRAQNEVRQVYQVKGTVDDTRLDELKYLKSVIKETLRLHTPVPLLIPRESIEQCKIHGYDIPPKTRVLVNAWAIGRDPEYWPEPDTFKPERFEDVSIDYKGSNFELIPFGAGRRMCPGLALGVANVEFLLAMLLYHFDWKLPDGIKAEDLDMDELFGITVRRKNDLLLVPIPYSSSALVK